MIDTAPGAVVLGEGARLMRTQLSGSESPQVVHRLVRPAAGSGVGPMLPTALPLYLLALIVAIANTPLDVFQVNAWNVGTLHIEPWRRKATAAIRSRVCDWTAMVRQWFEPGD